MADTPLARWRFTVWDRFGNAHDIWADHIFDEEDGLILRRGPKGSTVIVASFRLESWSHYLLTEDRSAEVVHG